MRIRLTRTPSQRLISAAALYLLGRLLHPIGMDGWMPGRTIGIATTMLIMLGLAIYAVYLASQYSNPLR